MIHRRTGLVCVMAVLAAALALGGCRKQAAHDAAVPPAAEDPASALASRLNAMTPAAQVDTLRALLAADSADANLQFFAGNAYYSFASSLDTSAPGRAAYYDSATAAYGRAVAIDPTMSKAYVNMGLAYADHNKPADARKALESAIAANPEDVLAYCHLGFLSHASGNLTEAMKQYQYALTIDPDNAQAHYNMGLAFAEAKIFAEALREWQMVVKVDPDGDLGKTAAENIRIIEQYMKD